MDPVSTVHGSTLGDAARERLGPGARRDETAAKRRTYAARPASSNLAGAYLIRAPIRFAAPPPLASTFLTRHPHSTLHPPSSGCAPPTSPLSCFASSSSRRRSSPRRNPSAPFILSSLVPAWETSASQMRTVPAGPRCGAATSRASRRTTTTRSATRIATCPLASLAMTSMLETNAGRAEVRVTL